MSVDRGLAEKFFDSYLHSLAKLKDSVLDVFSTYQKLLCDKLDCDEGKLFTCNAQPFCNSISDTLNRLDELETQLHSLESCLEFPVVHPSYVPEDLDRVSDNAQGVIEIVHQFQAALRSVVSNKAMEQTDQGQDVCNDLTSRPHLHFDEPIQVSSAAAGTPSSKPVHMSYPRSNEYFGSGAVATPTKPFQQQRFHAEQTIVQPSYIHSDRPYTQEVSEPSSFTQEQHGHAYGCYTQSFQPQLPRVPVTAKRVGIPEMVDSSISPSCVPVAYPQPTSVQSLYSVRAGIDAPLLPDHHISMGVERTPENILSNTNSSLQGQSNYPGDYQYPPGMSGDFK